jgi:RNA polymerase sigma-70 factor (ECF subfamily)
MDRPQDEPAGRAVAERLTAELPRLRSLLRGLLGARAAEADDLAQDVAARALRHAPAFDSTRPLWPWLRRMAVRAAIDHHGRAERTASTEVELSDRADPRAPAEAEARAQREQLDRLLQRLSRPQREVLVRFHRDGRSVAEIAAELRCPEGTVKSHLHRARRRLARGGLDGGGRDG